MNDDYLNGRPNGLRHKPSAIESFLNFAYRAWCNVTASADSSPQNQQTINSTGRITAANDDIYTPTP